MWVLVTSRAAAAIAVTVPTLYLVFVLTSTPHISNKSKYIHVHVIALGYILQSIHYGVTSTYRLKSSPRNCCRLRDCRGWETLEPVFCRITDVSSLALVTTAPSLILSCCKEFAKLTTTSGSIDLEDPYQFRRQSRSRAQLRYEPLSPRHGTFCPAIIAQHFRQVEANYSTHTYRILHRPVMLCPAMVIACSDGHYTNSCSKGNSHQILLPDISLPGFEVP